MIDLSKFPAEELDDWLESDVTQALIKGLSDAHLRALLRLEEKASVGDQPYAAAAIAGESSFIRRLLDTIRNTKGVS